MVDVDRQLSERLRIRGIGWDNVPIDTLIPEVEALEQKVIDQRDARAEWFNEAKKWEDYAGKLEKQLVAKEQAIQILMDRVNVLKFEVANKK